MTPVIVQLPFPSQIDPEPKLVRYYQQYSRYLATIIPGPPLSESDLWEPPLWVAHLDAAIGREDTRFADLSRCAFEAAACLDRLLDGTDGAPALFLFSPLAQNLDLAADVSKELMRRGHVTLLGGNMAGFADAQSFSSVYENQAKRGFLEKLLASGDLGAGAKLGRQSADFGYRPNYRFLSGFARRATFVRINASHGCLLGCSFCGDAWSRQLHVVPASDLALEFDDIAEHFPEARVIYVGDKTFGQSSVAVDNLIRVRPAGRYKFIVQTHVRAVSDQVLDRMQELGVIMVEMGFETADSDLLRSVKKRNGVEIYQEWIEKARARGMHVVLNLLGGLPHATELSHRKTLRFLEQTSAHASLYNLYNFVPYPKTPMFPELRPRIFDWRYANWREDRPVVFTPYHQTVDDLWAQFLDLVSTCDLLVRKRIDREFGESIPDDRLHYV